MSISAKISLVGLSDRAQGSARMSIWRMDNIGVFRHQGTRRETAVENCGFVHPDEIEYRMISMRLMDILSSRIGTPGLMADG
jgi:hypothetical protein